MHDILIIIGKRDCVRSKVQSLADQCESLEAVFRNFDKPQSDEAHGALERAQELLTAMCDGTATGSLTLDGCLAEVESFL